MIQNELFISIVYCAGLIFVYLYTLLVMDLNFFDEEQHSSAPHKSNKDLIFAWGTVLISLSGLYLLRFVQSFNLFFVLALTTLVFVVFLTSMAHILTTNHYLIERTSILCGDDADHARNFA
mmetsp:Transcript_28299/g.21148  ORF Transcript_28299/g.21148 Transcript_28299/m.21148 type:complete len:121 (+) Transcript_28299:990-1352(+)